MIVGKRNPVSHSDLAKSKREKGDRTCDRENKNGEEREGERGYDTEKRLQTSLRPRCSDGICYTYTTPNAISLIAKDNAVGAHPRS